MLTDDRTQVSTVLSGGAHHEEHLHLGLPRASQQGCFASGEHNDATLIESTMGTTKTHFQVDTYFIFNHLPTVCSVKRWFKTGLSQRTFCGIIQLLCHQPQAIWPEEQAEGASRTCTSSHIPTRLLSPYIFCHCSLLQPCPWQSLLES